MFGLLRRTFLKSTIGWFVAPWGWLTAPQAAPAVTNAALFEALSKSNPLYGVAGDAILEFTRTKLREDGFIRRIMMPASLEEFDRPRPVKFETVDRSTPRTRRLELTIYVDPTKV